MPQGELPRFEFPLKYSPVGTFAVTLGKSEMSSHRINFVPTLGCDPLKKIVGEAPLS